MQRQKRCNKYGNKDEDNSLNNENNVHNTSSQKYRQILNPCIRYFMNKGSYLQKKTCQRLKIHHEENSQELHDFKEMQDNTDSSTVIVKDTEEEDLTFEYHVVYSPSYGVPVLYFNIYRQDGSLLSLVEVWSLVPGHYKDRLENERWSFITQQEHPIIGRPYFYLHPCHTANLMKQVALTGAKKKNYILSWLSAVGPVVLLEIPLSYGKML